MSDLGERVLAYVREHAVGGLHDITIAKALDEPLADVVAALADLRRGNRIDADERALLTSDGTTTFDNIRTPDETATGEG